MTSRGASQHLGRPAPTDRIKLVCGSGVIHSPAKERVLSFPDCQEGLYPVQEAHGRWRSTGLLWAWAPPLRPLCDIVWASEKAWFQTPYATIRSRPPAAPTPSPVILGGRPGKPPVSAAHLASEHPSLCPGMLRMQPFTWAEAQGCSRPCSLQAVSFFCLLGLLPAGVHSLPSRGIARWLTPGAGATSCGSQPSSGGQMRQAHLVISASVLCPIPPALVVTNILTLQSLVSFISIISETPRVFPIETCFCQLTVSHLASSAGFLPRISPSPGDGVSCL